MTTDGYERLPTLQLAELLFELDTNDPEAWPIYCALRERLGEPHEPAEQRERDARGRPG